MLKITENYASVQEKSKACAYSITTSPSGPSPSSSETSTGSPREMRSRHFVNSVAGFGHKKPARCREQIGRLSSSDSSAPSSAAAGSYYRTPLPDSRGAGIRCLARNLIHNRGRHAIRCAEKRAFLEELVKHFLTLSSINKVPVRSTIRALRSRTEAAVFQDCSSSLAQARRPVFLPPERSGFPDCRGW
jgi:hypothetical protein